MENLKKILSISRPISWINTAAPFAAGFILSVGNLNWLFVLGFFFFLIPYNLMMYGINDIFDYESDKNNPRKNSIEGAVAPPTIHSKIWFFILITALPCIFLLLLNVNLPAQLWLIFLCFMVIAYSIKGLRFKEIPFLDSFTSSTHFYGPFVFACLLGGSLTGFWPAIFLFTLWGMASHAFGAIQDIQFDKEANIQSIATVLGARRTAQLCFISYCLVALLTYLIFKNLPGLLVAFSLTLYPIITSFCLKLTDSSAQKSNLAWKQFLWVNQIVGFSLTVAYLAPKFATQLIQQTILAIAFIIVFTALVKASRTSLSIQPSNLDL